MMKNKKLYEKYATTQSVRGVDLKDRYTMGAKGYDYHYGSRLKAFLKERGGPLAVDTLDVGCGHGIFLHYLKRQGVLKISGIDLSQEQVALAKNHGFPQVRLADAIAILKKEKKTYDLITAFDVLEHLERPELIALLTSIHERLKPGGIFLAQFPNALCPLSPAREADITHVRAFSPNSARQVALMAGFEKIELFRLPQHVFNAKTLLRRMAWELLVEPVVRFYGLVQMGNVAEPIYTGNLAILARKCPQQAAEKSLSAEKNRGGSAQTAKNRIGKTKNT